MPPIRAELRRTHYGPEWRRLSRRLREASGHRCECRGECGRDHAGRCPVTEGIEAVPPVLPGVDPPTARRRPPLSVAHLNHTPGDDRPENLRVFCSGCHLRYDQAEHLVARERRRERERAEAARVAGQRELFDGGE